jgi:hypothetical protein
MSDNNHIHKLLKNLSRNIPKELQDKSVEQLMKINDSQVQLLVLYIEEQEYWQNLSKVLNGLGFTKIKSIIPNLLELLQDINYSGSREAAEFLRKLGEPIMPYIKEILLGEDVYWKYNVLIHIVEYWPVDLVKKLENEITSLSRIIDYENGMHISALRIMAKNGIGNRDGLIRRYNYMIDRYEYFLIKLRNDEEYFKY